MDYGLIGERLGHSYSPQIHALLGNDRYELRPIPPEELDAFLRARNFRGLNVTIPYKQAVLPYCAQLSDTAREIGSVNTLVVRPDGSLLGHNTDIGGFTTMLREAGIDPAGKKAVVLGSGGTSLTARTALRRMGAREIVVVSRRGPVTYDALPSTPTRSCWSTPRPWACIPTPAFRPWNSTACRTCRAWRT